MLKKENIFTHEQPQKQSFKEQRYIFMLNYVPQTLIWETVQRASFMAKPL